MQGSLDNPPVTVMMSRGKTVWLLLLSLAFTAMGVWMANAHPRDWHGYLCAVIFALGTAIFFWQLFSPKRLEISAGGLSWFNGHKTRDYAWKDFTAFSAYRPSSRSLSKHLGFVYAPESPRKGKAAAFARAMTGVDGSFGGQWEMSPDNLADLLNKAKQKWG